MPTFETRVKYTREEVYSRREVIEILSVGTDVISRAISAGILRTVEVVDAKGKFFIKYEIEALRGSKVGIVSRRARQLVEKVRSEQMMNVQPRSTRGQELVDRETEYGYEIQSFEENEFDQMKTAFARNPSGFFDLLRKLFGRELVIRI
jgi:hypothetical protein